MPRDGESIDDTLQNIPEDIDPDDADAALDPDPNTKDTKDIDPDRDNEKEDLEAKVKDLSYPERTKAALSKLFESAGTYLTKEALPLLSPKYAKILENIQDDENEGIHLVYSQFKTVEGIGVFKLVLKANGFIEFRIKKTSTEYQLDVDPRNYGRPMFACYTGDETDDERAIILNVLNSDWSNVPANIVTELTKIAPNNFIGEIMKVLMITSSGAEGISLRNVRYVHIMEPYWHPVRTQQVVGRARRICSHSNLPKEKQTVEVFLYLMKFSEEILKSETWSKFQNKDKGMTSDEYLFDVASKKEKIMKGILRCVKESSIDCLIHAGAEDLKCFSIGNPMSDRFIYDPNVKQQLTDEAMKINTKNVGFKPSEITINGEKYVYNPDDLKVYDEARIYVGNLIKDDTGKITKFEQI